MPYKDKTQQKAAARRHYEKNREKMIARARSFDAKQTPKVFAFILEYLQGHCCVDCGESDPIVLEFDHRPNETKRFSIGDWRQSRYGFEAIKCEIAKCDVRCANCHRRVTYARSNRTHRGILPLPL
jgi:hypothetical protein